MRDPLRDPNGIHKFGLLTIDHPRIYSISTKSTFSAFLSVTLLRSFVDKVYCILFFRPITIVFSQEHVLRIDQMRRKEVEVVEPSL